jgi:hypothetical protein
VKAFFCIALFIWVLCGVVGAWWLGEMHVQEIALGPLTLAKAFNDVPVTYPGP